jgi:hypothetical protein
MDLTIETLEAAIASGQLDGDIGRLSSAVEARLAVVRAGKKATDFGIGDMVKFNNNCGTRYLVGHTARVVGMKRTKIVVKLDKPMGRFAHVSPTGTIESANITVPIAIVDPA